MKRRALKLLLFLLAGAIINVAVAWGFAMNGPQAHGSGLPLVSAMIVADIQREIFPTKRYQEPPWRSPSSTVLFVGDDTHWCWRHEAGWPLRSVPMLKDERSVRGCFDLRRMRTTESWSDTGPAFSCLPYFVLWPGFAINTIFSAAIVWFMFFAPGAVRRRVRRRRGQCTACGYSLKGSAGDVCPECGASVMRTSTA